MARISTWRLALAAAAVSALTLTGCGGGGDDPAPTSSATDGGDSVLGGAPAASASAGAPGATPTGGSGSGSGSGSGNSGGSDSGYPKDAKGYTQELLKAMAKPDYTRIGQLAVQAAVQQVKDSVSTGGVPNSQWPYVSCTPNTGANQSTCVARNSHGDQLTVKLNQLQFGFPTSVLEAQLDRTTYPAAPADYVSALLSAYGQGNQQRMVRLSGDAVAGKLKCDFRKQVSTAPIDGNYTKVTVDGLGADLGKKYEFKVVTMSGGKPNAVKEALAALC